MLFSHRTQGIAHSTHRVRIEYRTYAQSPLYRQVVDHIKMVDNSNVKKKRAGDAEQ